MGMDVHLTDTYFVVAHFHYVMVGGAIMGFLAGIHYWWPKISGRMYHEGWSKISAMIIFVGFNLTFFPQFLLGYMGMPRRYHVYPPEFQVLNVLSSAGASILGIGYLIPFCYLLWSLKYGPKAPPNPWGATGARMADDFAAADGKFRGHASSDQEAYTILNGGGRARWIVTRRSSRTRRASTATSSTISRIEEQQKDASTIGMWVFLVTEIMFFGGLFLAYFVYRQAYPAAFASASNKTESSDRRVQYDGADLQQLSRWRWQ